MNESQEIRSWIDFACECNNVPELKHKIDFSFNGRFTRKLGDATYRNERGKIRLSSPLWPRTSPEEQRATVIHEACHVVAFYNAWKKGVRIQGHGIEWKDCMIRCNLTPDIYHCIDRTGLKRKTKRYDIITCPRESKCQVTQRRYTRVKNGGCTLSCSHCQSLITIEHLRRHYED